MKRNSMTKMLSLIVCIVLIAAMALCITGCGGDPTPTEQPQSGGQTAGSGDPNDSTEPDGDGGQAANNVLGEGATSFRFSVVDPEGVETEYEIHTDKTIVGEALQELGLISGEEGPYGLYIKTVNGITLDYNTDGMYWSFYVNGEYGMTGVDGTDIEPGVLYTIKAEAA